MNDQRIVNENANQGPMRPPVRDSAEDPLPWLIRSLQRKRDAEAEKSSALKQGGEETS